MGDKRHHDERRTTASSGRATPRQRQILELASTGLSDREIAGRLHISSRDVRFQFERIFGTIGVRNRTDAINVWMASKNHALRPPDECPYPKPFPDQFAECPGYLARHVVSLDERGTPTGSVWTCRHLESRLVPRTENRWYGACVLGNAVDRKRWAEQVGPHRVRMMNLLLHELAPLCDRFVRQLWALKADEVRAVTRQQDSKPSRQSIEVLADRFLDDLESFVNVHRRLLQDNELASDACLDLARQLIDRVKAQRSSEWNDTFNALMRMPEDVWPASRSALHERPALART